MDHRRALPAGWRIPRGRPRQIDRHGSEPLKPIYSQCQSHDVGLHRAWHRAQDRTDWNEVVQTATCTFHHGLLLMMMMLYYEVAPLWWQLSRFSSSSFVVSCSFASKVLHDCVRRVLPNTSRPHPLCLFSEVASRLSSSGVHSHDFYRNFCSACAVTVVIFGHLNRSFYLLTYLLTYCGAAVDDYENNNV